MSKLKQWTLHDASVFGCKTYDMIRTSLPSIDEVVCVGHDYAWLVETCGFPSDPRDAAVSWTASPASADSDDDSDDVVLCHATLWCPRNQSPRQVLTSQGIVWRLGHSSTILDPLEQAGNERHVGEDASQGTATGIGWVVDLKAWQMLDSAKGEAGVPSPYVLGVIEGVRDQAMWRSLATAAVGASTTTTTSTISTTTTTSTSGDTTNTAELLLDVCISVRTGDLWQHVLEKITAALEDQHRWRVELESQQPPQRTVVHHFYGLPKPLTRIPFTAVYTFPMSELTPMVDDAAFIRQRESYHQAMAWPTDRALIRPCHAIPSSVWDGNASRATNKDKDNGDALLRNVHTAFVGKECDDVDVERAIVRGDYDYFHYGVRNERDGGWGCAYRSLQTMCSWLRCQQHVNAEVPTIREIQQALVACGDKTKDFIGSSEWIGSFEVSLCLDELFGIQSQVLNVASGGKVVDMVPALLRHFDREGSPVMIGGGVLAYTLVGVEWNEETEQARYLILDPHYGGKDQLSAMMDRRAKKSKWCGWRDGSLFKSKHFYNFCLMFSPKSV